MKEISEYTLKECLEEVEMLHGGYGFRDPEKLADRIHELTRWIPVSERMPTEEDSLCLWVDIEYFIYYISWARDGKPNPKCTHWKRITPPEGV
jgi:hypothetical protein